MTPEVGVTDLVALLNQTFEIAYPEITVVGELANLRVSKNRWVYFDLKDSDSTVKFFGTVYMLPGPLEDGMLLKVRATPRLHNQYGFSMTVRSMQPAGEGSIKKVAALLQAKLEAEGLFDPLRKRPLPYPPSQIGLITSRQSAAYADFVKILDARWGGVEVSVIDVQVQGEPAPAQIAAAVQQFNAMAEPPEVLVLIRGGGSAEDLAAFSTEQVTRAVAASRVPTLVAIGHEIDLSLAELAADQRASTPSNAAELLVPDRRQLQVAVAEKRRQLLHAAMTAITNQRQLLATQSQTLHQEAQRIVDAQAERLSLQRQLLTAYDPAAPLKRGYAIIRQNKQVITSVKKLKPGAVTITFGDGDTVADWPGSD